MQRRPFLCRVLACALAAGGVRAADASRVHTDSDFAIDLPGGYLDPVAHVDGASVSRGFRKPYAGAPVSTVILVTVHNYGPTFAKRVAAEPAAATRETLDDIVASIAKNRSRFRAAAPRSVTISGYNGLAVSWRGTAQGVDFEGVVFCVLAGPRAYAVQIQDRAGRGGERMAEAVRAVERMRILRSERGPAAAPRPVR